MVSAPSGILVFSLCNSDGLSFREALHPSMSIAWICRLTKQRKAIILALQTLTMDGDDGYGSAVDKTDELRRNMQLEVCTMVALFARGLPAT